MKRNMDKERFEEIWELAEADRYGQRLAAEYPAWRARRNRVVGMLAVAVIAVGVAVPLLRTGLPTTPTHDGYTASVCNRTGIADQYWVDMADQLLMKS